MELTRKQVIKWLSILRENLIYFPEISSKQKIESLDYVISSLKTDEAYQVMYEGGEIYTKADMIDMLTKLKKEIEEMKMQSLTGKEIWNNAIGVCSGLVQQKIDKLKGNENENK